MARRNCRVSRLVVALLICTAGGLGAAGSAGAYLRDFEHVRLGTPTSSAPVGGRSFSCPGGKFLIGVGGGVPYGSAWTGLGLTGLWIRSASQGVGEVSGVETDPHSGPWHMAASGYCATFTMTQPSGAPGATYIKEVQVVSNSSPMTGSNLKTVTAGCLGREAIGGGFYVVGPGGSLSTHHVTVHGAHLIDGDNYDGYMVQAQESDFSFSSWRLTAYAICANRSSDTGGPYVGNAMTTLERISNSSSVDKGVQAPCPAGKRIIGGSAEVLGATDTTRPPLEAVLTTSAPTSSASVNGWNAIAVEEDPTTAPWRVRARAVCAPFVPHS